MHIHLNLLLKITEKSINLINNEQQQQEQLNKSLKKY